MTTARQALRHSILAARDFRLKSIDVPEWGFPVHVRTLSLLEAIAFEEARASTQDTKVVPLYLTFCVCDEDGQLVFERGDVEDLCAKDPDVLSRIFNEAHALSDESTGEAAGKP